MQNQRAPQRTPQRQAPAVPEIARCKLCANGDLLLPVCQLQYPSLDTPTDYQGDGRMKYRATFIFQPSADLSMLEDAISAKMHELKINSLKNEPIRDDKDNEAAGFAPGIRYINASGKFKPMLIDLNKEEIESSFFYPGCVVRPRVSVYGWTNFKPFGVGIGLQTIQFVRDGTPLSSGGSSGDLNDFDDINPDDIPF